MCNNLIPLPSNNFLCIFLGIHIFQLLLKPASLCSKFYYAKLVIDRIGFIKSTIRCFKLRCFTFLKCLQALIVVALIQNLIKELTHESAWSRLLVLSVCFHFDCHRFRLLNDIRHYLTLHYYLAHIIYLSLWHKEQILLLFWSGVIL